MIAPKTGGFSWDPENRDKIRGLIQDLKNFGGEQFPSMWELFLMCAVLGWRESYRKPVQAFNGQSRETNVPYRYFPEIAFNLLVSIGLAESDDAQVLLDETKLLRTIEEFAAGGLSILIKAQESNKSLETWLTGELHRIMTKEGQHIQELNNQSSTSRPASQ